MQTDRPSYTSRRQRLRSRSFYVHKSDCSKVSKGQRKEEERVECKFCPGLARETSLTTRPHRTLLQYLRSRRSQHPRLRSLSTPLPLPTRPDPPLQLPKAQTQPRRPQNQSPNPPHPFSNDSRLDNLEATHETPTVSESLKTLSSHLELDNSGPTISDSTRVEMPGKGTTMGRGRWVRSGGAGRCPEALIEAT